MDPEVWMRSAIEAAREGIRAGQSPFGSVIVRDGELVAAGHNQVWHEVDPTAHAEVQAIRSAAQRLHTIDLSGAVIFTTCEPCPMCASAIHWARLDRVYYGATISDARGAGFNELVLAVAELYRQGGSRVEVVSGVLKAECAALFQEWLRGPGARSY